MLSYFTLPLVPPISTAPIYMVRPRPCTDVVKFKIACMFNDYDVYQMNYFQSGVGGLLGCLQYLFPNAVDPWFGVD